MRPEYKALGSYGTLGLEIALSILFGAYGGYWLDGKLHTGPWLLAIGFFFGCGAAVKAILRNMAEMKRDAEKEEKEHGNPAPLPDEGDKGVVRAADERRVARKGRSDRERS